MAAKDMASRRFANTTQSKNPVVRAAGPGSTHASQTLFDRMGGEKVLDMIVSDVYNNMRADKEMGPFFAKFRLDRLKDRTVDYLRGEWGGPSAYEGVDLWVAHSHLGVKNKWFDGMMEYYTRAIRRAKVGRQEEKEMLASLQQMRGPVVDKDHKFRNMHKNAGSDSSPKLPSQSVGGGTGDVAKGSTNNNNTNKRTRSTSKCRGDASAYSTNDSGKRSSKHSSSVSTTAGKESLASEPELEDEKEVDPAVEEQRRKEAEEEARLEAERAALEAQEKAAEELIARQQAIYFEAMAAMQPDKEEKPSALESRMSTKDSEGPPPKQKVPDVAFMFAPIEDTPPNQLPGSMFSGEELLGRLSVSCHELPPMQPPQAKTIRRIVSF
mmetsp:Transcript_39903/g.86119  ORF Transcript_39903/g.86119 Transcript_39903/m.86119 type:complete len:381 (-) Transcript_39903:487-1629(-)|eukprot:CAMPEP_0206437752 /NCGR_PEP_ID=MMETSP0324_2-20121206/11217_1 /ASSEMBLY_ACC=CAM_ASM_000836 /TAXON_ID=2866 /ORGANISM="Crypthecodinium cohnii, Strain Seligo" /LENGTH=380 /DNA_ID=CAMNT_0053905071 /DNA_START=24 /DNA_END=1166 /DNA_ORIENTATION=+